MKSNVPLLLVVGVLALGAGVRLLSFTLIFFGLTLLCLVPIRLTRATAAATVLASIFATLLVLEVALAVLRPTGPETPAPTWVATDRDREVWMTNDLGSLPAPGTSAVRRVTLDGETLFDVTYTIDADGFRVTPGAPDADALAGRLDLFGGSFAFGEGLEDNETLAYHLSRTLNVEVQNFGIMGGGPHQALAILESEYDTSGTTNVLLTGPWHAGRIACRRVWVGGAPRYRLIDGKPVRDGVCPEQGAEPLHRALRHSRVFDLAERAYLRLHRESSAAALLDLYVAVIGRMAELSDERGQALIVAYLSAVDLYGVTIDNTDLKRRLAATGATVVDVTLAPSLERLAPEYYLHELDLHPTALANEARAALLAPMLAEILKE